MKQCPVYVYGISHELTHEARRCQCGPPRYGHPLGSSLYMPGYAISAGAALPNAHWIE